MKKKIAIVAVIALFAFVLVGCGGAEEASEEAVDTTEEAVEQVDIYTGIGEGHEGDIEVEVEIDGDEILEVRVIDHQETEGIADPAIEELPSAIVDAQSTDVDTVSGATKTSEAIIEAVNEALVEAGI
ncbi:FMN-binding protein [Fuchsiella alkaliacetigena]|uniref:FMN-binding protein n=1 Tax=Fuchsiella alkaliacetigena TaxID=957042 RepID=UPI00200B2D86|nr:FMN-binding protein [Fuchsiella alkaliacetigena]MCK8824419.1 FMN-binding protein [Fuchsiella alkaliacetigena]